MRQFVCATKDCGLWHRKCQYKDGHLFDTVINECEKCRETLLRSPQINIGYDSTFIVTEDTKYAACHLLPLTRAK